MTPEEIKEQICEVGRRLYQSGFTPANDGNISAKLGDNEFYCTPTGVSKGYMTPDMILKVDGKGNVLEGNLKPSSEFKMHLKVYERRPDVTSVVHAHPPIATTFAVANMPLDKYILPEFCIWLGSVPVCQYGTPSTNEVPESLEPYIENHDAFLLQNHGALTVGSSLMKACFNMESLEFNANVLWHAMLLGKVNEIDGENLVKLAQLREKFSATGRHPGFGI